MNEKRDFPESAAQQVAQVIFGKATPNIDDIKRMGAKLKKIWPSLALERGQNHDKHYSFTTEMCEAYAAYYSIANALKIPLILEEMRRLGLSPGDRILDIGSGPGSVALGVSHRFPEYSVWNLERSKNFVQLGQRILPQSNWVLGEATDAVRLCREKKIHLVCASNSLSEFAETREKKKAFVGSLLTALTKSALETGTPHWLILAEPASRDSSRELLELRSELTKDTRARLWLPCLDDRTCGALVTPSDWCHEEVACEFPDWHDALGAEAGLRKEALLFSYLVYSVGIHPNLPDFPHQGYRMVSQRLEQKGQTACFLCSTKGKIKVRVQTSKITAENRYFLEVKRGDIFSDVTFGEKGDVLQSKKP